MVECTLFMTHCLQLNLQLHTISLVRTCRISSFCTVVWHLARCIARSLGDSWASCKLLAECQQRLWSRNHWNFQTVYRVTVQPVVNQKLLFTFTTLAKHFCVWSSENHRHRTDKYLDTLLPIKQIGRCCRRPSLKVIIARWQTARVIISLFLPNQSQWSSFAVIGYAEAGRQWHVVCCNVEYLNFGMQNLHPSNVKVIF